MAAGLGVSRTVVLLAYAQLESEGYTSTRIGSGTYVSEASPPCESRTLPAPPTISTVMSPKRLPGIPLSRLATRTTLPPPDTEPPRLPAGATDVVDLTNSVTMQDERGLQVWRHTLAQAMHNLPTAHPGVAGVRALRTAILEYLRAERGVVAEVEDVIIVNGSQQARDLIARVFFDKGTVVGMEDPCYWGTPHTFAAAGARIVACPVDEQGFDIAAHSGVLRDARLIYVAPSWQFPTGVAMSRQRREALLEWVYARRACIVEDDFDCEHRYGIRTTPSLQGMDRNGRVIYLSSFARALYPALQLGYMVVPPALRGKFHAVKWLADRGSMSLEQYALAAYVANGEYARGLRRLSRRLARKYGFLVEALRRHLGSDIELCGQSAGSHLFARLPLLCAEWTQMLLDEALRRGLRLQSGEAYHVAACPHVTLMLCYATVPEARLDAVARRLVEAYRAVQAEAQKQPAKRWG